MIDSFSCIALSNLSTAKALFTFLGFAFGGLLIASSLSKSSSTKGDVLEGGGVSLNVTLSDSLTFLVCIGANAAFAGLITSNHVFCGSAIFYPLSGFKLTPRHIYFISLKRDAVSVVVLTVSQVYYESSLKDILAELADQLGHLSSDREFLKDTIFLDPGVTTGGGPIIALRGSTAF
ncbi:hypothetical protein Tco_0660231 [Tanacetum coccineum]